MLLQKAKMGTIFKDINTQSMSLSSSGLRKNTHAIIFQCEDFCICVSNSLC